MEWCFFALGRAAEHDTPGLDHKQTDPAGSGKRLVLRYALVQAGCAAVVAAGFWLGAGAFAARAALAGGVIAAAGTALFGWRLFSPGVAPAARVSSAMWAGEALKWLWIGVALWLALAVAALAPLPLIVGLIAAQFGFWLGIALIK